MVIKRENYNTDKKSNKTKTVKKQHRFNPQKWLSEDLRNIKTSSLYIFNKIFTDGDIFYDGTKMYCKYNSSDYITYAKKIIKLLKKHHVSFCNGDFQNYDSEENVIIREFNFGTLKNKEMSFPDNCCFKKQLPLNYLDSTNVIFLHKEYTIKQKSSNRQIHFEALHFSDKNVIMDIQIADLLFDFYKLRFQSDIDENKNQYKINWDYATQLLKNFDDFLSLFSTKKINRTPDLKLSSFVKTFENGDIFDEITQCRESIEHNQKQIMVYYEEISRLEQNIRTQSENLEFLTQKLRTKKKNDLLKQKLEEINELKYIDKYEIFDNGDFEFRFKNPVITWKYQSYEFRTLLRNLNVRLNTTKLQVDAFSDEPMFRAGYCSPNSENERTRINSVTFFSHPHTMSNTIFTFNHCCLGSDDNYETPIKYLNNKQITECVMFIYRWVLTFLDGRAYIGHTDFLIQSVAENLTEIKQDGVWTKLSDVQASKISSGGNTTTSKLYLKRIQNLRKFIKNISEHTSPKKVKQNGNKNTKNTTNKTEKRT